MSADWRYSAVEVGNPFGPHLDCDTVREAVAWANKLGITAMVWRREDGKLVRKIGLTKGCAA